MNSELLLGVQATAILTCCAFTLFIFLPKLKEGHSFSSFFIAKKRGGYTIILTCFYIVLFSILFYFNTHPTDQLLYGAGAALAFVGLIIAFIGRMQLKTYWTPITQTAHSGGVLDTGLFKLMRHPIYTGRIFFFSGVMMMFYPILLLLAALYAYLLNASAKKEEAHLCASNPDYISYTKRTKRWFLF